MMSTGTHGELVQSATNWIRQRASDPEIIEMEITGTTHLFEKGVLDSLGLVDLIAFLEEQTNSQIDLLELNEQEIATLNGLCRAALSNR